MDDFLTDEEIQLLIDENPRELLRIVTQSPAFTDRVHRLHKQAVNIYHRLYGIDPESRAKRQEAEQQQNRLSEDAQRRILEIESDPAWRNRHDKNHKALVTERFNLLLGREEPQNEPNGDAEV